MKIIELLNKIANNEEVPKKIKVSCYEFEWREEGRYYANTTKGNCQTLLQDWLNNANKLNIEVEIIEEEIDIQSIEEIVGNTDVRMNNKEISAEDYFYTITNIVLSINELKNKQNESLKAVKQLDKNIKELR